VSILVESPEKSLLYSKMGTISKAIGFGVGALITTAAAGAVVRGINRFPRPRRQMRRKRRK